MLDIVIRGGTVVDGTRSPSYRADVGISDGRIVSIGRDIGSAHRVIDASDRVVAPGFIDVHTHLDAQAFWDPTLGPSPLHGVTTVFGGNCGFSIAPLCPEMAEYVMRMLARVEGMPLGVLETSVPWNWQTTEEFLGLLEGRLAVNAGFMVGHSAIRCVVMGDDANVRKSTPEELGKMCELLRAGLRAGGLGFSSTWSQNHSDGDGKPVPSRSADTAELVALAGTCREFPGTSLEFLPRTSSSLPLGDDDLSVMIEMSRAAQRPLNWNLMRVTQSNMEMVEQRLDCGRRSRENGARVVGLLMPQPIDTLFTFRTGFLLDALPGWGPVMSLGLEERIELLRHPEQRRRLERLANEDAGRRELTNLGNPYCLRDFRGGKQALSGPHHWRHSYRKWEGSL